MKIAITSQGNSLESKLDQRFGHCQFFVTYNSDNGTIEIIPNPYHNVEEQAGALAVKLLSSKNVAKIISGEFGLKVKPMLDSLKIQMIILKDDSKTVQTIIEMLNKTYSKEE